MRQMARASLFVLLVVGAAQGQQPASQLDKTSISGTVVNGASGKPEAGVWVIAETKSLPTPFRKIVVTDDQGRFLVPETEKFTSFRMPYPMPFFTRGLDGRIDDAGAGWKGRGLWASFNSYLPKYSETRIGYVSHIQLRLNPLAN